MTHWTPHPVGTWVQLPAGDWLLVSPGGLVALLCLAGVFAYCWGVAAATLPQCWRRRVKPKPKRRNWRGVWR